MSSCRQTLRQPSIVGLRLLAVDGMARKIDELTDLRRSRLSVVYGLSSEPREFTLSRDAIAAAQRIAEDVVELAQRLRRETATVRGFVDWHRTA